MNPRLAATYVLYDVIVARKSLSSVLNEQLSEMDNGSDRGLCQEIVFGTLRNYASLQQTLAPFLNKKISNKNKPLEILLCSALYQLRCMDLPSYAVINESVSAVKAIDFDWATGFINAVLRNIIRSENSELKQDKNYDHPSWLAKRINAAYPSHSQAIFKENHNAARVTLRIRNNKRDEYLSELEQHDIAAIPHIDNKEAVVLTHSTQIAQLPGFTDGRVTVQDANAQLAANLLSVKHGLRVLDACAAPGGKTAHIADKADDLHITAIDNMANRVKTMNNTLQRLNVKANVVTADVTDVDAWHDGVLFDRILLDAPCSATGVIRKHPDILFHRRESDIEALLIIQFEILDSCWRLLKQGGRMLYATCSILPEENCEQIRSFLARTPDAQLKSLAHNRSVDTENGMLQFLADEWGDGFFYAAVEKV
ncbi:MAG: 16S rRNA (cytosine(967)-C(5))-methyltransferase RsmB [Gammaproteobacteria bacterium]|nr:16S rRNA (cytosine(967)-C(5))-methyltransferase RsmB [Gammaproteobacteria bacterium]